SSCDSITVAWTWGFVNQSRLRLVMPVMSNCCRISRWQRKYRSQQSGSSTARNRRRRSLWTGEASVGDTQHLGKGQPQRGRRHRLGDEQAEQEDRLVRVFPLIPQAEQVEQAAPQWCHLALHGLRDALTA